MSIGIEQCEVLYTKDPTNQNSSVELQKGLKLKSKFEVNIEGKKDQE